MKFYLYLSLILCYSCTMNEDKKKMLGDDYRLYKETAACRMVKSPIMPAPVATFTLPTFRYMLLRSSEASASEVSTAPMDEIVFFHCVIC